MASTSTKVVGKKRGAAWPDDDTRLLLSIWDENCVEEQLEDPKVNNTRIYKSIAVEMTEKGCDKTPEQCKIKVHTLKRAYRESKGNMKKSGKGRKTCKFFEQLDAILGSRPASSPVKVIESLTTRKRRRAGNESNTEETDSEGDESETERQSDEASVDKDEDIDIGAGAAVKEREEQETEEREPIGPKNPELLKTATDKKAKGKKKEEVKPVEKQGKGKKARKSRFEVAMGSVMEGFGSANEKAEDKFLGIESQKLDLEKKRLDLEKSRMESDERQKREERQHQYNMMKMIMGAVGERPVVQTGVPPGPSTLYQAPAVPYGPPTPSAQVTTQRDQWTTDEESSSFSSSGERTYYNL